MKNVKKNPNLQLEKFSNVFMQIGLVLVLFVVYISLEYASEIVAIPTPESDSKVVKKIDFDKPFDFDIEKPKPKYKPKDVQPKIKQTLADKVDIVDNTNETEETVIDVTPEKTNDLDEFLQSHTMKEDDFINPDDEPTSFNSVQVIPIFKGCEGLSKEASKKCFDTKMKRLVQRYFDASIAEDLGLSSGKKRIFTEFIIDKDGNVSVSRINAPHKALEKEAIKIVSKIPQFTPGEQNGKKVKVKYMLPITFMVE